MSDVWSARARCRTAPRRRTPRDADLDLVVEMCEPHAGMKILDVATGGGHVARRLRERGAEVVSSTRRPGCSRT